MDVFSLRDYAITQLNAQQQTSALEEFPLADDQLKCIL